MQRRLDYAYDFALSFARQNRDVAYRLYALLAQSGAVVFYDTDFQHILIGRRLTKEFRRIYGSSTRYVVPIISRHYDKRDWTEYELSIAKKEWRRRKSEFILPVRLDDTKILGLPDDLAYIDLREISIQDAATILLNKMGLYLRLKPIKWAAGYAVNMQEFMENITNYKVPSDVPRGDVWRVMDWLKSELAGYLSTTGVVFDFPWVAHDREYDGESFGLWVPFVWDPDASELPIGNHDPWELVDLATYEQIFGEDD